MKILQRFILNLAAVLLLSGAALALPVSAENSANSGSDNSGQIASVKEDDGPAGSLTPAEVENHAHDLTEQFRGMAQTEIAEKKTQVKEHTQQQRQQACEARQANLTKRMSNAVKHAQNHKAVFDKIYTRVKEFHDNKNLNAADYDVLASKVDAAQADAAANITALQSLDVSVDCTSQTAAQSVSAFQQAVKNTRDSLKTYRSAIVDLINSLKGASTSSDSQSGGRD
jgi:hypothetical protein